jgi:hypothetical protein
MRIAADFIAVLHRRDWTVWLPVSSSYSSVNFLRTLPLKRRFKSAVREGVEPSRRA